MEHKNIIAAGIVLILIIAGMFVFASLKKTEIEHSQPTVEYTETTDSPYKDILRIDAKHFYIDGIHTLVGEIPMPTTCDLLSWETDISELVPERATVRFNVVNHSEGCPQAVTSQRFKVVFAAQGNIDIDARFDGRDIELNLIPALEGETPDDFELFLKG